MADFTEHRSARDLEEDSSSASSSDLGVAPEDIIDLVDAVVRMSVILCTGKLSMLFLWRLAVSSRADVD